ncbi:Ubiquitin carboxyl-terminal hydrolases family 2 [Macleaya cordata]|uniref:Ubiquitin carboxyl-terminal hydrolase n=1 Tax=Macleaya cordata TaxID=56857 RepID=A0A200PXI7_MACCD|nr:Ubiquitin carboxyl-terminal hydrolases family 2 [Macleaya cordata]
MESEVVSEPDQVSSSTPSPSSSPEKTLDFDDLPFLEEPNRSPSPSSPRPFYGPYFPETNPYLPSSRVSFPEFFKPPPMIGAGLYNLGNTCFLNSVLQCFTHTVPLLQSLASINHSVPCRRDREGFCVICTLLEHIEYSLLSPGRIISPFKFVDNLSNLSSLFQRFQQEDAHEFLQCLLDRLDSCCVDIDSQVNNSSPQEDSFVKKIFGGRLKSQLQCCDCGHCSDTFEPLIDLSLEIEDVDTLPDALKSFTKVEKIEDSETKFTCEKCQKEVLLEKRFTVDQAPSVATFHLKRFKSDGFYVEKIDKYVEYPLELDLQPFTSSNDLDASLKYELYAVVVHIGLSNSSGHYFCYIRSSPQTWYRMDDSKVLRVREEYVLNQEAYILFYARQGTPWFSSFFMDIQKQTTGFSTSPNSVLDNLDPIRTPSPGASKIIADVEIREDRERVSNPSLGESKIIGDVETRKDEERISTPPPPLGNCNFEVVKDRVGLEDSPKTPTPRSPSPDIYSEEPPGVSYNIPRDHLKMMEEEIPCRRSSASKAMEDSKRQEALRLTRSMPSSRAMRLRACLGSPKTEGSLKRKKHKSERSYDSVGSTGISPLGNHRRRLIIDF